jgi:hypothetical protein
VQRRPQPLPRCSELVGRAAVTECKRTLDREHNLDIWWIVKDIGEESITWALPPDQDLSNPTYPSSAIEHLLPPTKVRC